LIPIIQTNPNSYIFLKDCINIRLKNINNSSYAKYIDKVYIEYEKLKDYSSKKIKLNFFTMQLFEHYIIEHDIDDIYTCSRIGFHGSNIGWNHVYSTNLNFAILTTSLDFEEKEEQKKLEFNEMILYIIYYNTKTLEELGRKKININYDDLIIKQFLGNIFYIIPIDKETISIKDIAYNYHKKNKDRKITFNIDDVFFVPNIYSQLRKYENLNLYIL